MEIVKFCVNQGLLIIAIDFIIVALGILWLLKQEEKENRKK